MRSDGFRAGNKQRLGQVATIYVLAALGIGLAAGGALGWAGSHLAFEARALIGAVLAVIAIGIGLVELSGRRVPLVQLDRETPAEWIERGPTQWALRNGLAIGFGGGTRLGFWLWYVVPLGAFLSGSVVVGAVGYGCYSLIRTLSVGGMMWLFERGRIDREGVWVLEFFDQARTMAATQLVVVGLATLVLFGA